jgi:hypothetical protein
MKNKRLLALLAWPLLFFAILLLWARFNIGPTAQAARVSSVTAVSDRVEPSARKSAVRVITVAHLTFRPRFLDASVQENALILEGIIFVIVGMIWSRRVREKSV